MNATLSRLAEPLERRTEQAAARRSQTAATESPPQIAAHSPLHELFIEEIGASLPSEILQRIKSANQVGQLHDWFAAAGLYRWISSQPDVARDFLAQLGGQPREAGLALATALARKIEIPPPQPLAREFDLWGAAWQSVGILGLSVLRAWAVVMIIAWLTQHPRTWAGAAESFLMLVRGDWLTHSLLEGLAGCVVVAGWLCVEGALAPRVIDFIRELPYEGTTVAYRRGWHMEGLVLHAWLQPLLLQVALAISVAVVIYHHWRELADLASASFALSVCGLIVWMLHLSARAGAEMIRQRCLLLTVPAK